jgi:hypothetical protein
MSLVLLTLACKSNEDTAPPAPDSTTAYYRDPVEVRLADAEPQAVVRARRSMIAAFERRCDPMAVLLDARSEVLDRGLLSAARGRGAAGGAPKARGGPLDLVQRPQGEVVDDQQVDLGRADPQAPFKFRSETTCPFHVPPAEGATEPPGVEHHRQWSFCPVGPARSP